MILNRVAFRRKKKGIKQYVLANQINAPQSLLSCIEAGKVEPTEEVKKKLAKVLGCRVSQLFEKSVIATRLG